MKKILINVTSFLGLFLFVSQAMASCEDIDRDELLAAAMAITNGGSYGGTEYEVGENGGFPPLQMWVTVVNETGKVCHVINTGGSGRLIGNISWLGSRVISAQKANTANAFSIDNTVEGGVLNYAISTAILFGTVQGQNSLFGLQHSNPVNPRPAYRGNAKKFGTGADPMTGRRVGGINVFGGGLALYNEEGKKVGAIGVSGNTSCTDHVIAWKIRDALSMNYVQLGFTNFNFDKAGAFVDFGGTLGDEMIIDTSASANQGGYLPTNGWEHADCPNTPGFPGNPNSTDDRGAIIFVPPILEGGEPENGEGGPENG